MGSISRVFLWILCGIFLLTTVWIFIWWFPWMGAEIPWNRLTEKYSDIWDYTIWKQKFRYNICSKASDPWCLDWELLGITIVSDTEAYIYFKLKYGNGFTGGKKFYGYKIHQNDKTSLSVSELDEIPMFGYLFWGKIDFFSESDLLKMEASKSKAFETLRRKPSIIINWINYTK